MKSMTIRLAAAAVVGLGVGFGVMAYDNYTGAAWVVPPGKVGQETKPGTVAVRPIRSETADILPYKWVLFGALAGLGVLFTTRQRPTP